MDLKMITFISAIVFVLLIAYVESIDRIGKWCHHDNDCSAYVPSGVPKIQLCVNSVCQCRQGFEVKYDSSSLKPTCDEFYYSLKIIGSDCIGKSDAEYEPNFQSWGQCREDEECRRPIENGAVAVGRKKSCFCKQGFLRVGGSCLKASHQKVLQPCHKISNGDEVLSCNIEEFSLCSDGKCICFDSYFANTTSGKCEPFTQYMKVYNLTEYRVKPNEYCTDDSHCILGLECRSLKCSCPHPCTYNSTAEGCDCGEVTIIPPILPVYLGVFLGLAIVAFWACMILRTAQKYTKRKSARFSNLGDDAQPSPSNNSYALNSGIQNRTPSPSNNSYALSPGNQNRRSSRVSVSCAGLGVPSANVSGRRSPSALLSNNDPLKTSTSASDLPPPYSSIFSASYPPDSTSGLPN